MAEKLTYEFVNEQFEKKGYTLVSTEYINSVQKLDYFCPIGHPGSISYANFNQGQGCRTCSYIERGLKKRQPIKETDNGIKLKQCSKCRRWLPLTTCFYPDSVLWHGYSSQCKDCQEQYRNSVSEKRNDIQKKRRLLSALYDTYATQIDFCEEVRRSPKNQELLQVKCTYCKKWYCPTNGEIVGRVQAIKGNNPGECNLYCSEECKHLCCEFRRVKYPEGFTPPNVEPRPEVKESVKIKKLEEANYTCEFCDETEGLKLHHIRPVKLFPELTNDPGNILVVCEKCHHEEHSGPDGLSYAMIRDIAKEREGFYGIQLARKFNMKKIFRFNELDVKIQEEMIAEYIEKLTKNKSVFRAFAYDYFVEQEDVFNEIGDRMYDL